MRMLALTALLLLAAFSPAAPALAEKPPRWEYAELNYRTLPARPAGVDADGKEVPALPNNGTVGVLPGGTTLASSIFAMEHMVRVMMRDTDAGLAQVIRMASLTPAERTGFAGERGSLELNPNVASRRHLVGVPEQPEARHIGDRIRAERPQSVGGRAIERAHRDDRCIERSRRRPSVALRLEYEACPERLRQEQSVTHLRTVLRPDPVRVHGADDGEAVLRLVVANRVAAGENRPRRPDDLVCSREDLTEYLGGKLLRERRYRECEERHATHGKNIIERVGRRDRAEVPRIVDDRREEVDGEHDRPLVVEAVDGRVIGRVEADEELCRVDRNEACEQRLEASRRILRGAPAGLRERGQRRGHGHEISVRTL